MKQHESDVIQQVAKVLYGLGFTQTEILRLLEISRSPRLKRTLQEAQAEYPNRPTSGTCFVARLGAFCALEEKSLAKGLSKEELKLSGALHVALKMPQHFAFLNNLVDIAVTLAVPQPPASDKQHATLIKVLFRDELGQEPENYWGYLKRKNIFPESHGALRADILRFVGDWCRAKVIYPWPENGRAVIDRLLAALNPRNTSVLRQRFGMDGNPPMTLEEVANPRGATRERIRQFEAKGLRQLGLAPRKDLLRQVFLTPMSSLHQPLTAERIDGLFKEADAKLEALRATEG